MAVKKLSELAGTIRSKNAGVNQITFDIIFGDEETYRKVLKSGALKKEAMARLFGISLERISSCVGSDHRDQKIHHLSADSKREPRRLGYPRVSPVWAAPRCGDSLGVDEKERGGW